MDYYGICSVVYSREFIGQPGAVDTEASCMHMHVSVYPATVLLDKIQRVLARKQVKVADVQYDSFMPLILAQQQRFHIKSASPTEFQ